MHVQMKFKNIVERAQKPYITIVVLKYMSLYNAIQLQSAQPNICAEFLQERQ